MMHSARREGGRVKKNAKGEDREDREKDGALELGRQRLVAGWSREAQSNRHHIILLGYAKTRIERL